MTSGPLSCSADRSDTSNAHTTPTHAGNRFKEMAFLWKPSIERP
jgi:hypothetical protein